MQILSNSNIMYGYNAAQDCYEDLMSAGIMDPTKVSYLQALVVEHHLHDVSYLQVNQEN